MEYKVVRERQIPSHAWHIYFLPTPLSWIFHFVPSTETDPSSTWVSSVWHLHSLFPSLAGKEQAENLQVRGEGRRMLSIHLDFFFHFDTHNLVFSESWWIKVLKPFTSDWDSNSTKTLLGTRTATWLGLKPSKNPRYLVSGPNKAQKKKKKWPKEWKTSVIKGNAN